MWKVKKWLRWAESGRCSITAYTLHEMFTHFCRSASRFGECTYSSSDNEILSLHCRRVLSSKNCRCYVVFVTMSTKYDDLVEKWWRQTDKHVIVTSSRTFSHITHTSLLITETHYNKLRISFNFRVFFQKIDTSIIMLENVIMRWYFRWGNRHAFCVQHSMTIVRTWVIMSPPTQTWFASTSPKNNHHGI